MKSNCKKNANYYTVTICHNSVLLSKNPELSPPSCDAFVNSFFQNQSAL